jgi:threonylcarbamoyladenosine tRNA methylthiotransferase MtaB
VKRVRLGSLEPRIITEDFVAALKEIAEISPQFHLSLQSGDDKTLRRMNRHYDAAAFRHSVEVLRAAWPDVAITTDVIVGFTGETEEDFLSSYRFVEEIGFYELHVFKYSRRAGTAADRMPGQLTDREKTLRSEKLIALDLEKSDAFRRRFLGREEEVIVEEFMNVDGTEYLTGYNRMYVRYLIPFTDRKKAESKIGQIIKVNAKEICKTCVLAMPTDLL